MRKGITPGIALIAFATFLTLQLPACTKSGWLRLKENNQVDHIYGYKMETYYAGDYIGVSQSTSWMNDSRYSEFVASHQDRIDYYLHFESDHSKTYWGINIYSKIDSINCEYDLIESKIFLEYSDGITDSSHSLYTTFRTGIFFGGNNCKWSIEPIGIRKKYKGDVVLTFKLIVNSDEFSNKRDTIPFRLNANYGRHKEWLGFWP